MYSVSSLHVDIGEKKRTAPLNGLFMGEELREIMEIGNEYAFDTVSAFVVAFIGRSLGFLKKCDTTWVSHIYTKMVKTCFVISKAKRGRRMSECECGQKFGVSGLLSNGHLCRIVHLDHSC